MTKKESGYFLATVASALVGSSVAVSSRVADFPWLGGLAIRYGCAAVVLGAIVHVRGLAWPAIRRSDLGLLVLLAAAGMVGFNIFLIAAVERADPGMVGAIVGTVPLVLAVLGPIQAGRAPTSRVTIAAVIVVAGAALAEGTGTGSLLGVLLAFGALAGEASFSLLAAPLLPRLGPMFVSVYACVIASVMALFLGVIVDREGVVREPSWSEGVSLFYLGVMVSGLAFFAWYTAIGRLGVERTGLFSGLMPVFALLTGWLLVASNPNPLQLVGAVIVGAGVSFGISKDRPASRSTPVDGVGTVVRE